MKGFVVVFFAAMLPVAAFAGNIFGSLSENRQPAKGVDVTVTCGSNQYRARTDDDGSYNLRVDEPGRCTLSVDYKDQTPETEVFSYDKPTRYDFELVTTNGK